MDELRVKVYTVSTEEFGTITGSKAQLLEFYNVLNHVADEAWDRSHGPDKPEAVKEAWLDYWCTLSRCARKVRSLFEVEEDER